MVHGPLHGKEEKKQAKDNVTVHLHNIHASDIKAIMLGLDYNKRRAESCFSEKELTMGLLT